MEDLDAITSRSIRLLDYIQQLTYLDPIFKFHFINSVNSVLSDHIDKLLDMVLHRLFDYPYPLISHHCVC